MKNNLSLKLIDFHFGTLSDAERINLEKEMLVDPEVLLDFFDLKRELEVSCEIPSRPSLELYSSLIGEQTQKNKKPLWVYSLTTAAVATFIVTVLFFYFQNQKENELNPIAEQILFDGKVEHSLVVNVL